MMVEDNDTQVSELEPSGPSCSHNFVNDTSSAHVYTLGSEHIFLYTCLQRNFGIVYFKENMFLPWLFALVFIFDYIIFQ